MMKKISLAVAILGLAARGYYIYQLQTAGRAPQNSPAQQLIAGMRQSVQDSTGEAAGGAPASAARRPATATPPPAPTDPAAVAARQEIEAAIKALHVTTIMPGTPGLVIIDKTDYAEGDDLPLPKGRKARITSVRDDGVLLACNGQTFHLDPPQAPDLDALRKKR